LEKPSFLFLKGSWGAPTSPVATVAALADAPAALTGASAARAAFSTDYPAAGAHREHLILCRLCGPWRRGLRIPPLGGAPPVALLFFLLSFLRTASSCSRRYTVRATARAQGVGGSDRAAFTVTLC
jgi:hypothetical protein